MSEPLILNMGQSSPLTLMMGSASSPLELTIPTGGGGNANVVIDTTAHWAERTEYIPRKGTIVVYSDRNVIEGVNYPGVKIGDGSAYLVDLPFVGDDLVMQTMAVINAHATNVNIHVTAAEKEYWNNKLDSGIDGETLILSPALFHE